MPLHWPRARASRPAAARQRGWTPMAPTPFRIDIAEHDAGRSARAARPHALPRPGAGRAVGVRRRPRLREGALRLLARSLRLAEARGDAQRLPPVHGAGRGHRSPLHPRGGPGPHAAAAAALPRLAGLGLGVPQDHPDAHGPGALRRRPARCLHRGRAVAAGLRLLLRAGPAALRRDGDRRRVRRR